MNILSLFDGMSCGQLALDRAGIPVNNYLASEVDYWAQEVSAHNFPDTQYLGDVRGVNFKELNSMGSGWSKIASNIDLILAGSPCQGFSMLGNRLNFEDPRSKLFFEFVRCLEEFKPKYFLLENVKMMKSSEKIITDILGVKPIEINSSLLSAQNRRRLYWTNIPGVEQPEDLGIINPKLFRWSRSTRYPKDKPKYVESRAYMDGKSNTLVTGDGCSSFSSKSRIVTDTGELRKLTPGECEWLQTVPAGYTKIAPDKERYKMIGNGWTIDVIAHILKNMEEV